MAFMRALVQIPRLTTLTEDVVTNTLYFDSDTGDVDDIAPEVHAELTSFYQAIDVYLAAEQLSTTATVDYYDMADPEPRVPKYTATIALTLGTGNSFPPEVAICMSFRGAEGSGVNMRRRKGRIYLGPLVAAITSTSGGRVAPSTGVRSAIATAGNNLMNQTTTFGTKWAVFSPTTYAETGSLDDAFEDVVAGWVDSEFDIQRRRGTVAQARTVWP